MSEQPFDGEDRRQDRRVADILKELGHVAHDLQSRSQALVAMVDVLQKEVIRQDQDDAVDERTKKERLGEVESAAREILDTKLKDTPNLPPPIDPTHPEEYE